MVELDPMSNVDDGGQHEKCGQGHEEEVFRDPPRVSTYGRHD